MIDDEEIIIYRITRFFECYRSILLKLLIKEGFEVTLEKIESKNGIEEIINESIGKSNYVFKIKY